MKKTIVIFGIALAVVGLVVVSVFAGATLVRAQSATPGTQTPWGRGGGMMGDNQAMEESMHAALAEKLGISVDELESQITAGKTFWQIAEAKGLTSAEATTLMQEARDAALTLMVADGKLTQEQADWMKQRGAGMMNGSAGAGRGGCPMMDGDETTQDGASGFTGRRGMMGGRGMMGR
jgi:hypothetical protein